MLEMVASNKCSPGLESECPHGLLLWAVLSMLIFLDVLVCRRRRTQRFSGFFMLSELRNGAAVLHLASFPGISFQITVGQ